MRAARQVPRNGSERLAPAAAALARGASGAVAGARLCTKRPPPGTVGPAHQGRSIRYQIRQASMSSGSTTSPLGP